MTALHRVTVEMMTISPHALATVEDDRLPPFREVCAPPEIIVTAEAAQAIEALAPGEGCAVVDQLTENAVAVLPGEVGGLVAAVEPALTAVVARQRAAL